MEPLIACIEQKNIIKDSIPEIIKDARIYNIRFNIILDMSNYHFKENRKNYTFLRISL